MLFKIFCVYKSGFYFALNTQVFFHKSNITLVKPTGFHLNKSEHKNELTICYSIKTQ